MSEAKSKRDLIWEQKKKARERKSQLNQEDDDQQQNNNDYQNFPQNKQYPSEKKNEIFAPATENNNPVSLPSGSQQKQYHNAQNNKQEQQEIQQYQQKQYDDPPQFQAENQFIKAQRINNDQIQSNQDSFQPQQNNNNFEKENINQNKFIKAQYGDYLKEQIQQKEEIKQRERTYIQGNQQPSVNIEKDEQFQKKNAKAQYGEYLRNQMKEKEENKNTNQQQQPIQNINPNPNYVQAQQFQEQYQPSQQKMIDPEEISKKNQKAQYGEYLRQQMQVKQLNMGNNVDKKLLLQQKMEQQQENPFGRAGAGAPNRNQVGQTITKRNIQQDAYIPPPPPQQQQRMQQQDNSFQQQQYVKQQQPSFHDNYQQFNPIQQNLPIQQQQQFQPQNDYNYQYNQQMPAPKSQQQQYNYQQGNQFQQMQQFPDNQMDQPYNYPQHQDLGQNQQYGGFQNNQRQFNQNNDGFPQQDQQQAQFQQRNQQQLTEKQRKILELQEKNENFQYDQAAENQNKFKEGQRNLLKNENISNEEINKKKQQQMEFQKALQEQIEQKKIQKQMEEKRRKLEEQQEEERLRKEQEEIERKKKEEENDKKSTANNVEKQNEDQRQQRTRKRKADDNNNNQTPDTGVKASIVNVPQQLRTDISKDFIKGEKQRDGVESSDSLADFYRKRSANNANGVITPEEQKIQFINVGGGPAAIQPYQQQQQMYQPQQPIAQVPPQMIPQIEEIKKAIQDQQQSLQMQLQAMKQETHQAFQERDKAEKELSELKEQLKQRMMADELNQRKLRNALSKYNPEKQTTYLIQPPNQTQNPLYDIQNQIMSNPLPKAPIFQPKPAAISPITQGEAKYYYGSNQQQEENFKQHVGLQSLVSDNKFIPLDIIDSIQSGEKVTMSKLMNFNAPTPQQQQYQQRPSSSKVFSNQEKDQFQQYYNQNQNQYNNNKKNEGNTNEFLGNKRPNSSQSDNKWAMASINSDITKEIDILLKNQNAYQQPQQKNYNPQQNDSIALDGIQNNYNSNNQKQSSNNYKGFDIGDSPSTFNYAAKGVLGTHNGTFTVNENNENAQALSMYSEFPDLNALDINSKKINSSQLSQNDYFHNNLSNLSKQTDTKYMQFNQAKQNNTGQNTMNNASLASVNSDKDFFKQQAINSLGMKGSGVQFNTAGNTTQGTFDLDYINKKNEDRLKKFMALGLNTVNEEDEPLKKSMGYKHQEGQDDLDKLDKLLDKYNDQ